MSMELVNQITEVANRQLLVYSVNPDFIKEVNKPYAHNILPVKENPCEMTVHHHNEDGIGSVVHLMVLYDYLIQKRILRNPFNQIYFADVPNCCGAYFLHGCLRTGISGELLLDIVTEVSRQHRKGMLHYYVSHQQTELKKFLTEHGFKEGSPFIYNPNSKNNIQLLYKDIN